MAAKTCLMLGEKKGNATMQGLVDLAARFWWSVTRAQVEEAAAYLFALTRRHLPPLVADFPHAARRVGLEQAFVDRVIAGLKVYVLQDPLHEGTNPVEDLS
jgi:hypothetical protein